MNNCCGWFLAKVTNMLPLLAVQTLKKTL